MHSTQTFTPCVVKVFIKLGFSVFKLLPRDPNDIEQIASINNFDFNLPHVYPNPLNGILFLELKKDQFISIYNLMGDLQFNLDLKAGKQSIDLSNLTNGIYILYFSNSSSIIKLVIQ